MPRAAKRQATAITSNASISSFARVSKASNAPQLLKKAVTTVEPTSTTKKRKASSIQDDHDANHLTSRRTVSFAPSSDDELEAVASKRSCRRQQEPQISLNPPKIAVTVPTVSIPTVPVKTPVKGKRTAKALPSRTETAHKPAVSTPISKARSSTKKTTQVKIDALFKKTKKGSLFPEHLAELVDLHRAFLKTVLLQISHNGSNVPVDIQSLSPHISRNWGKRQVTLEDIQRCVAIQSSTKYGIKSPFTVSDYGRGKLCIELDSQCYGTAINQDKLCKQFELNLQDICSEHLMNDDSDVDINMGSLSLSDLPKATITNRDLGIKANPLLAKGHQALTQLKDNLAAKQHEEEAKKATIANTMLNPDGTKMSLLDRLRFKQLTKDQGSRPPSGPELERRAALSRVMDVSATISMLTLSNPVSLPRQAFTLPAILEKLRDSLRVPVSAEEATKCIRLVATEIAPEWIRIVTIGGRDNVVVQRHGQPIDRVLQERVNKLLQ